MHFHHVMGILFIGWPLVYNHYGSESVFSIIWGEITSPLMNSAEVLENIEKPKNALAMNIKKVFMGIFILIRIFACYPVMILI